MHPRSAHLSSAGSSCAARGSNPPMRSADPGPGARSKAGRAPRSALALATEPAAAA
jgi:hypothetical protein